jgi:hypothetical protein
MIAKLILFSVYILLINYSLRSKKNYNIKIILIIFSILFVGIFSLLIIYENFVFLVSEIFKINFYIFLISFNMFFLIIFSIYLIKEIKSIKENLTTISRKISIKQYVKK